MLQSENKELFFCLCFSYFSYVGVRGRVWGVGVERTDGEPCSTV